MAEIPLNVSMCELYKNADKYEGKRITISATITQLANGKYLYPSSSCDEGYSFVRVDLKGVDLQAAGLRELESPRGSSERKEFDVEVTGIFDGKYKEDFEGFRFRIVPIEVKQKSAIRIGKPLGAG